MPFWGDMLVPWRVKFLKKMFSISSTESTESHAEDTSLRPKVPDAELKQSPKMVTTLNLTHQRALEAWDHVEKTTPIVSLKPYFL